MEFESLPIEVQEIIKDAYDAALILGLLSERPIPDKFISRRLIKKIEALWPKQFGEGKEKV